MPNSQHIATDNGTMRAQTDSNMAELALLVGPTGSSKRFDPVSRGRYLGDLSVGSVAILPKTPHVGRDCGVDETPKASIDDWPNGQEDETILARIVFFFFARLSYTMYFVNFPSFSLIFPYFSWCFFGRMARKMRRCNDFSCQWGKLGTDILRSGMGF